jgi:hypothetical protein
MKRTTLVPRVRSRAVLCAAFVVPLVTVGACKDDKKDSAADAAKTGDATKSEAGDAKDSGDAEKPGDDSAGGIAGKIAGGLVDDIAPADKVTRGDALGHILIANPNGMLDKVAKQAAPSKFAASVNEAAIKALGGMALGDKAAVVQHLDFAKPFGCVVVDSTVIDVPVACTMGYTGGSAALATDLGSDGKQADAGGHVAHYLIDGNDVFVDDLGGQVVVSNHTELFAKAKGYIESNMIGRAGKVATDIELVGFFDAASKRYRTQLDGLLAQMESASSVKTGKELVDAMMEYNKKSQRETFDRMSEIEQITIGLGLEPVGLVARFATFPVEGSKLQAQAKASAAGPMDPKTIQSLPESAFVVVGMNADWKAAMESEQFVSMRDLMIETYADATGKDAATVKGAVTNYMNETRDIYGNEWGFAFVHEPGTLGGIVMSQSLLKPGREHWRGFTKSFTPEAVLGKVGTDWVTWRFEEKVSTVDGVEVDRMIIEPGPKLAEEIKKEVAKSPEMATIESRLGGFKLVMDRAETADRAMYVFAPKAEERYMASLMAAAKGTGALGENKGIKLVFDRNPKVTSVMAVDGKAAIAWFKEIVPPEKAAEIPPGLGNDMGDMFMVTSYLDNGSQTGEFVIGQPLIDQVRKLAE